MIPLNPRHQGLSSSGPLSEVGLSLREVSSTLILSDENMANKSEICLSKICIKLHLFFFSIHVSQCTG